MQCLLTAYQLSGLGICHRTLTYFQPQKHQILSLPEFLKHRLETESLSIKVNGYFYKKKKTL